MANDKNSIILYVDIISTFEALEDDEAGRLIKHLLRYVNDLNPIAPDKITQIAFEPIKQQLKRDLIKWEGKKETKSKSGQLGGIQSGILRKQKKANEANASSTKQKKANEANASSTKQKEANEAVSVSVNVSDSVNVSVKENKIITDKSVFQKCSDIYNSFCLEKTNCSGVFDGLQGKSLKLIIEYLSKNVKPQPATDELICEAFQLIFDHYDRWDKFHQDQLKLNQINSNLINILNKIRNGNSNNKKTDGLDNALTNLQSAGII